MQHLIGHIGVDAGMCWIGDPCYVLPDDGSERANVSQWDEFCEIMQGQQHVAFDYTAGHEGLGVCVETGWGDGLYPVTATYDSFGKVASVTITFVDTSEEATEEED